MHYGVSGYPGYKTSGGLSHDIGLIIAPGESALRGGELVWNRFEPMPGEYHFNRPDGAGVQTIACPPAWVVRLHPDLLYKEGRGVRRPFGGQRHSCHKNPAFRDYGDLSNFGCGEARTPRGHASAGISTGETLGSAFAIAAHGYIPVQAVKS